MASPGSRPLLGSRTCRPAARPQPRILPAVARPQLPGSSLLPGACPPTQVLPTLLGTQLLGSIALHPVHAHLLDACCPYPNPAPYAWPAHRTCLRHSPRFSAKVAGVGVLPHCVSVGESLRLSELPPWKLLLLLKAVVSRWQGEMEPRMKYPGRDAFLRPARSPAQRLRASKVVGVGASPKSSRKNPALTLQTGEAFEQAPGLDPASSLTGPLKKPWAALGAHPSATPSQATQAGAASLPGADPRPIDPSPGLSRLTGGRCSTFSVIC